MAFERLQTEIALLLNQMQNEPEDSHELALQIHGKLQEMKAFGMPLPEDLVALDEALQSGALEPGSLLSEAPQGEAPPDEVPGDGSARTRPDGT